MNWSRLFNIDVGALFRGRVVTVGPEAAARSKRRLGIFSRLRVRIARSLRSYFTFKRGDLIKLTFNLSQSVASNAPLPLAIDALLEDAPTYRLYRVLVSLRESLEQGSTLADAMRRKPRFFPSYYINLVEAGERTGTLDTTLQNLEELLIQNREVYQASMFGTAYLCIVIVILSLITSFIAVKIKPVFAEIKADFAVEVDKKTEESRPPSPVPEITPKAQPTLQAQQNKGAEASRTLIQGPPENKQTKQARKRRPFPEPTNKGFEALGGSRPQHTVTSDRLLYYCKGLLILGVVLLLGLRFHKFFLAAGRVKFPGLYRISSKVWWVVSTRILGSLLQAGYPLDEALTILMNKERSRTFRKLLGRLHEAVTQGRPFYEAVGAEGNRVPPSLRDCTYIGETSGRLPQALMNISHFYQAQIVRTVIVLGNIGFPVAIMGLGCFVFYVYSGVFYDYFDIMQLMMSSM